MRSDKTPLVTLSAIALIITTAGLWLLTDPHRVNTSPSATSTEPHTDTVNALPVPDTAVSANRQGNADTPTLWNLFPANDPAWAWAGVDMQALRRELPDNLYWELAAPTDDQLVLEQRQDNKDFWHKEYGKVLSNTATEQEVRAYYAYRQQVASDYIAFSSHLLQRYGQQLPDRDRRLLELVKRMHSHRLKELPTKLQAALQRREAHAQARAAWLADQAAFED